MKYLKKLLNVIIVLFYFDSATFAEIVYKVLPEATAPNVQSLLFLDQILSQKKFQPIDSSLSGLGKEFAVDQIWISDQYKKTIYLKLGVEPDHKIDADQLIPFLKGHLWHTKLPTGSKASILFMGMEKSEVQDLISAFQKKTAQIIFYRYFIPSSEAASIGASQCSKINVLSGSQTFAQKLVAGTAGDVTYEVMKCLASYANSANDVAKKFLSIEEWRKLNFKMGYSLTHPKELYEYAIKALEAIYGTSFAISQAFRSAVVEGITMEELKATVAMVCSASGGIFAGMMTGKITGGVLSAGSSLAFRFAQRLTMSKMKNTKEIMSCVGELAYASP